MNHRPFILAAVLAAGAIALSACTTEKVLRGFYEGGKRVCEQAGNCDTPEKNRH